MAETIDMTAPEPPEWINTEAGRWKWNCDLAWRCDAAALVPGTRALNFWRSKMLKDAERQYKRPALLVPGLTNQAKDVDLWFGNLPDGRGIVARQGVSLTFLGVISGLTSRYEKVIDAYYEVSMKASESTPCSVVVVSRCYLEGIGPSVRAVISTQPLPKFVYNSAEYAALYNNLERAGNLDLCTLKELREE